MTITYRKCEPDERPLGRLAEVSVQFEKGPYGPLEGLAIKGIGLWAPARGDTEPRITFPARIYESDGRRERYDLLVPADPDRSTEPLENAVRDGWTALHEQSGVVTLDPTVANPEW